MPRIHALLNDSANNVVERGSVAHPQRIRFAQRLPDGSVVGSRPLVGPEEQVTEQLDTRQLVHTE